MPHIHTKPGQHDHTASAYVFRTDGAAPRVMLHTHRTLHVYLQFGGHVELHEHLWSAVAHELREESGYDLAQLTLLQPPHARLTKLDDGGYTVVHPIPFSLMTFPFGDKDHYHTDAAFVFTTDQTPNHAVGDGESDEFVLLSRDEVAKLPAPKAIPYNVRANILFAFDHVLGAWEATDPHAYRV